MEIEILSGIFIGFSIEYPVDIKTSCINQSPADYGCAGV